MTHKILWIVIILLITYGIIWAYMSYRTVQTEKNEAQTRFAAGSMPDPLPNGKYKGIVVDYKGEWKGKSFNAAESTGINQFGDTDKYPFKTYTATGLRDANLKVLRIDYNVADNPLYLRFLRDEITQVSPGHYQGKIMIQWFGAVFTVGYFQLEQ